MLVKPRIAIDCVFFQIANSGIARVWRSLLKEWVANGFSKHLLIIDRGGTAPKFPGLTYEETPVFDFKNPAIESIHIQEICDREHIDLFISTYHTIPLFTPSVVLVHDMLPELFNTDLSVMPLHEKYWSILHAAHYICISNNTARDLQKFMPSIKDDRISITLNGISKDFYPQPQDLVEQFRNKYKIGRPFFLVVGNRYADGGHKNVVHFFRAFKNLPDRHKFAIVCVGGVPTLEPELAKEIDRTTVYVLSLSDSELVAAYSGATALVYPSLYEGFGLPILEAMACGCPVITCANSSLTEVAGDAAIYVSETESDELTMALIDVQRLEIGSELSSKGLVQAQKFSWTKMAEELSQVLISTFDRIESGELLTNDPLWSELRKLQVGEYREGLYNLARELEDARQKIIFMQNSNFWKLRQQWFRLKQMLRLVDRIDSDL